MTLAEVMIVPLDAWSSYTTPNDNPTYPSINVCKAPPEVDKGSGCYPATSLHMVETIPKFVEKQEVTKRPQLMYLLYILALRVLMVLMLMGYP